jgi:hypothetical protein
VNCSARPRPIASENLKEGANTEEVQRWSINGRRVEAALAFEHAKILDTAANCSRSKVESPRCPSPSSRRNSRFRLFTTSIRYCPRGDESALRKRMTDVDFGELIERGAVACPQQVRAAPPHQARTLDLT